MAMATIAPSADAFDDVPTEMAAPPALLMTPSVALGSVELSSVCRLPESFSAPRTTSPSVPADAGLAAMTAAPPAGGARPAARPPEPGVLAGSHDPRAVGRRATGRGNDLAAGVHLQPAPGARARSGPAGAGIGPRHRAAGLRGSGRS